MEHVILLALTGMVMFGLADYFLKKSTSMGIKPDILFFYALLISALPFGVLHLYQKPPMNIGSSLGFYSFIIGTLTFIASISLVAALKKGEASIVVPIARMAFVVTSVCAFIFLGEVFTIKKGLGILLAIISILLLSKKEKNTDSFRH